ncbi:NADH-quinone oxidoreductase subunit NuoH [Planctomicrobium sp. SH527]|uniref:NADH-quinone oxidoreductase subunit NuoH n=1 Tax=Planctomicrobium sp. SH527 TaxID=3448123 RepID=UPI003F5C1513
MPEILVTLITISVVIGVILGACSYLIWVERKLSAVMQDRIGPNRVGFWGLLQPIADGLKFLFKEEMVPSHVDKVLFVMAPAIALFTAMLALAVVPFGPVDQAPEFMRFIIAPGIDIGLVYILAIGSLNVYAVVLGGWASNNKYSALGALRASAQVVSYEIPLGMSIIGIALLGGTLNLEQIQTDQAAAGIFGWYCWYQPLALLIFFTASLAESNRLPFDLAECEQELIGGFHTEYGALKFGLFFLGEYTHIILISFLTSILFFGGWHFPIIAEAGSVYPFAWLVKLLVLMAKVGAVIVLIVLIRWTIPRFRFDQLMGLSWKVFIPLAMFNILAVMTVLQFNWDKRLLFPISLMLFGIAGAISVAAKQREIKGRPLAPQKNLASGGTGSVAAEH